MYDTVLVPYDGSDEGKMGVRHGFELAAAVGATVHALYVIDLPGAPRALSIRDDEEQVREEYRSYGEELIEELTAMGEDHGVDVVGAIRTGSVPEEIIEYADEEDVGVIVMGSGYRGKIGAILGGTADRVVRTAPVPVLTRRRRAEEIPSQ